MSPPHGFEADGAAPRNHRGQDHAAGVQQPAPGRGLVLPEDQIAGGESDFDGEIREPGAMFRRQRGECGRENGLSGRSPVVLFPRRKRASSRAASSVMSIPTGHQSMQRPHPTHPELPNWSNQVPSLCDIHWRYRLSPNCARCRRAVG